MVAKRFTLPCMMDHVFIRPLAGHEAARRVEELSAVLIDCVRGGASVSFMYPLSQERADDFWMAVHAGTATGERILLIAEDSRSREILGTVQLVRAHSENQPHRADVAKMLVKRAARRRGIGAALMRAAEEEARRLGLTLLVLDTEANGDAVRLYRRGGWTEVGTIPNYALMPRGGPCDTIVFYKRIGG